MTIKHKTLNSDIYKQVHWSDEPYSILSSAGNQTAQYLGNFSRAYQIIYPL